MRRSVPLLAETLRDAGYETVAFVANAYISPLTGLHRGFETLVPLHESEGAMKTADSGVVITAVERWLDQRRNSAGPHRPLFLFVNLMDAHLPYRPSREALEAVRDPAVSEAAVAAAASVSGREAMGHNLGARIIPPSTLAGLRVRYDGAVRELDGATARLFEALQGDGILEEAVVVVTSDHGEHLGELGRLDHRMTLHDAVLHVPLVVRWPGRLEGGMRVEDPVSLADLHPTLLDAAAVPLPAGTALDARSLTKPADPSRCLFAFQGHGMAHIAQLRSTLPPDVGEDAFERTRLSLRAARRAGAGGAPCKYLESTRHGDDGITAVPVRRLIGAGEAEDLPPLGDGDPRLVLADELRALLDAAQSEPTTPR